MTYTCGLCGYSFTEEEMAEIGCRSCPASPLGCGLVKCPACNYEWPAESKSGLVKLIRKLFGKPKAEAER